MNHKGVKFASKKAKFDSELSFGSQGRHVYLQIGFVCMQASLGMWFSKQEQRSLSTVVIVHQRLQARKAKWLLYPVARLYCKLHGEVPLPAVELVLCLFLLLR